MLRRSGTGELRQSWLTAENKERLVLAPLRADRPLPLVSLRRPRTRPAMTWKKEPPKSPARTITSPCS